MGRKIRYYLVARDKKTNGFSIIPMKDHSLEKIDLFTIQFGDSTELTNNLKKDNIISFSDVDYYVVFPKTENGKTVLKSYEVLYNTSSDINKIISAIAKKSLNGTLAKSLAVHNLIESFCQKMSCDYAFYDKVLRGGTQLYTNFVNYFNERKSDYSDINNKDNGWVLKSYPLLRNVAYTLRDSSYHSNDVIFRKLLVPALIEKTDESYDSNQFCFTFDEGKSNEDKLIEIISFLPDVSQDFLSNINSADLRSLIFTYILFRDSQQNDFNTETALAEIIKWFSNNPSEIDGFYQLSYNQVNKIGDGENGFQKRNTPTGASTV